jgi:hypothetical protein
MQRKRAVALLTITLILFAIGAVILGALGIDFHWQGFH